MRRVRKWRQLLPILAIVLAVTAFATGYEILVPARHAPPGVSLIDLSSVHQLESRFNHDRGKPRLILIFSPT
jgi:hypothetical protein